MTQLTIEQECVIAKQGDQRFVVVQKEYHDALREKDLLNRKLKVTLRFETI